MAKIIFQIFMGRVSHGFTSSSLFFSAIIEQAKHVSMPENYLPQENAMRRESAFHLLVGGNFQVHLHVPFTLL